MPKTCYDVSRQVDFSTTDTELSYPQGLECNVVDATYFIKFVV